MTTATKDKTYMDEQKEADEEDVVTKRFQKALEIASDGARELSNSLKLAALTTDVPFSHTCVDRAIMLCATLSAALGETQSDVTDAGLEW